MTIPDEEARAEATRRWHDSKYNHAPLDMFMQGAEWQESRPVTAEQVDKVADAIIQRATWPSGHWPSLTGVQHRDVALALARAALEAMKGTQS